MDALVSQNLGGQPPARPQRYELHLREGPPPMLVWRYREEGIVVTPNGLEWTADGISRSLPFSEIESVRLETGHVPRSGYFGSCTVTFRRGLTLIVTSLNSRGIPDDDRAESYAEFVDDLHARLSREDRRRISFLAGSTSSRHTLGMVVIVIAGAFFVLLPLVLLVITGEVKALFITLTGLAFVYPLFRVIQKNEPRSYNPDSLDDELFP